MCPSSQSLYFSPLSQVAGRALAPSLHPNRAPATAPLVSASPPWKQHQTTERSVTSRYHGSKISRSQQSFLTETAICIVERGTKRMGYSLFLSPIMHRRVIHVTGETSRLSLECTNCIGGPGACCPPKKLTFGLAETPYPAFRNSYVYFVALFSETRYSWFPSRSTKIHDSPVLKTKIHDSYKFCNYDSWFMIPLPPPK